MKLEQIKTIIVGVLKGYFSNKTILDKFSESDEGKLLYNNSEIDTTLSEEDGNAISKKDDGLYVEDKSEAIEKLKADLTSVKKYERYVNTELDYCHLVVPDTFAGVTIDIGSPMPFSVPVSSNMENNPDNYSIKLKGGKTYKITADLFTGTTQAKDAWFDIFDITNNIQITKFIKQSPNMDTMAFNTNCGCIYIPETDCEIQMRFLSNSMGSFKFPGAVENVKVSYFIVEEIGRSLAIDPVEHVNTNNGLEDTPVGHIISHMGTKAPKHYLICDGSTYLITDYPYLAEHIKEEFGSYYYFGGSEEDGTFAVPDLRNEFLRGYHCNGEEQLSGEIGVHQDATEIPNISLGGNANNMLVISQDANASTNVAVRNTDSAIKRTGYRTVTMGSFNASTDYDAHYTSRPTNTSVLYCIKYEPTYYMNIYGLRTEKVLFEGKLTTGSITLADSIENYDELEVRVCSNTTSNAKMKHTIDVNDVEYGLGIDFCGSLLINSTVLTNVLYFHFNDDKTFAIDYNGNGANAIRIYKIVGISYGTTADGNAPSSGGNCSCPTYTDEEVNTAIDEILIPSGGDN